MRLLVVLSALMLPLPAYADEIAAPAHDHAAVSESRFVVLEGGRNFRDVGGYATADGHVVKPGTMYRSGSLGRITPAALERLKSLHVATIVDLRSSPERAHDTADLSGAFGAGYWVRDYGLPAAGGAAMPALDTLTRASVEAMMTGVYRELPFQQAPAYRELFARLATAKGPLVVNCTAGKDRTGVATALVLTALGVPYDTVRKDFLLSNGAPGMETLQAEIASTMAKIPEDARVPLLGVEGPYLDAAFATMRERYGSVEGYMQAELGVGPDQIAALRKRMLD